MICLWCNFSHEGLIPLAAAVLEVQNIIMRQTLRELERDQSFLRLLLGKEAIFCLPRLPSANCCCRSHGPSFCIPAHGWVTLRLIEFTHRNGTRWFMQWAGTVPVFPAGTPSHTFQKTHIYIIPRDATRFLTTHEQSVWFTLLVLPLPRFSPLLVLYLRLFLLPRQRLPTHRGWRTPLVD